MTNLLAPRQPLQLPEARKREHMLARRMSSELVLTILPRRVNNLHLLRPRRTVQRLHTGNNQQHNRDISSLATGRPELKAACRSNTGSHSSMLKLAINHRKLATLDPALSSLLPRG